MKFDLITGRTLDQAEGKETGKTTLEYQEYVAVVFLNGEDMEELGLEEDSPAEVTTEFGSVTVKSRKGELDRGTIFMPLGPWASMIIGGETSGTGTPQTKGIRAKVSKAEGEVLPIEKVLKSEESK